MTGSHPERALVKTLDELSKEEVVDIAAMLFNYQLLGPTVIVQMAEELPWLVERAPKRWEMEAILALARRGRTVANKDDQYYTDCAAFRERHGGHEPEPVEPKNHYLVVFRIDKATHEEAVVAELEQCSSWWNEFHGVWMVCTSETASQLSERLAPHMDLGERDGDLLWIRSQPQGSGGVPNPQHHQGWLLKTAWHWINGHLHGPSRQAEATADQADGGPKDSSLAGAAPPLAKEPAGDLSEKTLPSPEHQNE